MILHLTTPTFDEDGSLDLQYSPNSRLNNVSRRVTKTATLDGGSTIVDLGHSPSDNDLYIEVLAISDTDLTTLRRLVTSYPLLNISTKDGHFSGVVSNFDSDTAPLSFTFLIKEKLSG